MLKHSIAVALMGCGSLQAAEFIVQTSGDTGGGLPVLVSGNTYTIDTLRSAIEVAHSKKFDGPDTIRFALPKQTTIEVSSTNDISRFAFVIRTDLTIEGPELSTDLIISARDVRHFNVSWRGHLKLSNVTLSDGNIDRDGGAILVDQNATLTVNNSIFSDNTSTSGGAISIESKQFIGTYSKISNSVFTNNKAMETNGFGVGGALSVSYRSTVVVDNCFFSENSSSHFGGGISSLGEIDISNTTITRNFTTSGGGIHLGGIATMQLANSTISSNTATFRGGGILAFASSDSTIINSTIVGNTAGAKSSSSNEWENWYRGISFGTWGGGILMGSPDGLLMHNSIVSGNMGNNVPNDLPSFMNSLSSFNIIGVDVDVNNMADGVNGNQIGTLLQPLDAMLGPLSNNGGMTMTYRLLPGSPAINAGSNMQAINAGLVTDQRGMGFDRIIGAAVDIGAFETDVIFVNGFE